MSIAALWLMLIIFIAPFLLMGCAPRQVDHSTAAPEMPSRLDVSSLDSDLSQAASLAGSSTPSRDTDLPSGYVGTTRCAECHSSQLQSYLNSDHSRSLTLWTPPTEVPIGQFTHANRRTVYSAIEKSGELFHREELQIKSQAKDSASDTLLVTATETPIDPMSPNSNPAIGRSATRALPADCQLTTGASESKTGVSLVTCPTSRVKLPTPQPLIIGSAFMKVDQLQLPFKAIR